MRKVLTVLVLLLLAVGVAVATTDPEPAEGDMMMMESEVKNPDTFVYGNYGTVTTFDPAVVYDTSSGAVMAPALETLVAWKRGEAVVEPQLALEVPTIANGGISADGMTYRFKIRPGVKFHEGGTLTPEDVEYSIERNMIVDVDHGPQWMYWMVFFEDFGGFDADGGFKYTYAEIDEKIEVDGDEVIFHLANPSDFFLGIMAGSWASIVDKEWMIENGAWDGTEADRARVSNPPTGEEFLAERANGTGPYRLERWVKGDEVVHVRFDDYWGPAPALERGIWKIVEEWSTRKLMFLQGDLDYAAVDSPYYEEMELEEGITIQKDLPALGVTGIMFQQDLNVTDNSYAGSGQLDGEGVPSDFFADDNVRLGFMHAFDEQTWLTDVGKGYRFDPVTFMPYGLPFKDDSVERPAYDLDLAADYFKEAFDGELWEKGFYLVMAYNEGNEERGAAMRILAESIAEVNPKFDISVKSVPWAEHLDLNKNRKYPLFSIGWLPDYPDADNYADPFMYSKGYFAERGSYFNPVVDELVLQAKYETDASVREEIYSRLQEIYIEDSVGIVFSQASARSHYRDWISFRGGWQYNAVKPGLYNWLAQIEKGN